MGFWTGGDRSNLRDAEVLLITLGLLAEGGYDRLRLDAVAPRAQVSKAQVNAVESGYNLLDPADATDGAFPHVTDGRAVSSSVAETTPGPRELQHPKPIGKGLSYEDSER